MPELRRHQLRVAGVAEQICLKSSGVDGVAVVTACLLHDMGNIIKFDLAHFPEFTEPLGFEYWEGVKKMFIDKYGAEEHQATLKIAKEIGVSEKIITCMKSIGFSHTSENISFDISMERKICAYADQRVGPHGVVSTEERLSDGRKRYGSPKERDWGKYEDLCLNLSLLENQVLEKTGIGPVDISDKSISEYMEKLSSTVLE